jgi:dihydroxyacetone kinase-like protein
VESIGLDEVLAWIRQIAARIEDADHGINMNRGFKAVLEKLESSPPTDIAGALRTVAMTLIGKVGGASGPLYGTMFIEMSKAVGDDDRIDAARFAELLRAGIDGVIARGKAEEGDKTMIDALEAAYRAISESVASGADLSEAVEAAVEGAKEGMEATIPMVARKGRASYLGERSAGHQDPGATSSHLILAAASETWR